MSSSVLHPTQFGSGVGDHARARVLDAMHVAMQQRLLRPGTTPRESGDLRESLSRNEEAWGKAVGVHSPEFVRNLH